MDFIQRRVVKGVMWVVTWPKVTLGVAAVVLAACVVLALTRLTISTDQNKLFSDRVGFFGDYLRFTEHFPENEAIYVVIEAKSPADPPAVERWTGLADQIVQNLRALPAYVKSVDAKVPVEKVGAQGLLLADRAQLVTDLAEMRQLAGIWGESSALADMLGVRTPIERFLNGVAMASAEARVVPMLGALAQGWGATLAQPAGPLRSGAELPDLAATGAENPQRLGYYYVHDESDTTHRRHLLLVRVFHRQNFTSLTAISETIEAIRGAVHAAAKDYEADFAVAVSGRPALEADEMRTTDHDTKIAEVFAVAAVFLGLVLMLRSLWLALVAEISLGVGIGWTFGWATLAVGELNLLSIVFVIALIGIGMDYLIQILTRYRREAQRYVRQRAIWARVFRYVSPPISTACLGAAGAFLVSTLTDFRGAADLGIIAGGGLLLCLLAGYTVLPAILVLWPARLKPVAEAHRYSDHHPPPRAGWWKFIGPAVWVVLLLAGIPWALKTRFNPNLLELQAPGLESVKQIHKLPTWYAVALSDDLGMLRQVRAAMAGAGAVQSTESILDAQDNEQWMQRNPPTALEWAEPPTPKVADLAKMAAAARNVAAKYERSPLARTAAWRGPITQVAEQMRAFADRIEGGTPAEKEACAKRLGEWQRAFVAELKEAWAAMAPGPLRIDDLPDEIKSHLLSVDGKTKTYALYIKPKADLWIRANLEAFEREVEARAATVPSAPKLTGISSNIYHTTDAIHHAFVRATIYACILIFALVLLDLRRLSQTLVAISVLALGLPMLVTLMGWLGVDWNFANFFALPILIGAGHEYGVFMVHRYREVLHNPRRVWRGWDVSDRALLLCAYVTCASFGFFWWFAEHRGLRSLGLVMAVGIACIYVATVVVVRPLLTWRIGAKRVYDPLPEDDEV